MAVVSWPGIQSDDDASFVGVLQGIPNQICQYLPEFARVRANKPRTLVKILSRSSSKSFAWARSRSMFTVHLQVSAGQWLRFHDGTAASILAMSKTSSMSPSRCSPLLRRFPGLCDADPTAGISSHDAGKTKNRVQRCAQLMAHVGQENALRLVCRLAWSRASTHRPSAAFTRCSK